MIDLGLSLDRSWLTDGPPTIAALRERGLSLSIDTLDPEHIRMADAAGVDYVLSLTPDTIDLARGAARDAGADHRTIPMTSTASTGWRPAMEQLDQPYLLDSILAPINSGFAASLARYVEVRRRHPGAEMLMGIGNLTELTEADSTGVTALLIGFCQEVGIGAVLTTEVIGWARGAVRETVLAAQIMHLAQRQARPPKHIDSGLVTSKDESMRAPSEEELRAMQSQISDANYRLFADAEWLYAFNGDRFVREANMYAVFDQLDVTDASHAFYLGKELMKATIARGLRKSYRQEGPLDWGLFSFPEPRREDIAMKKILIQLDTDQHPSAFDAIAAYDADVDVVLGYGAITAENLAGRRPGRDLPARSRRPGQHRVLGGWVKGARRRGGVRGRAEAVLQTVQRRRSCSTPTARTRPPRPPSRWSAAR